MVLADPGTTTHSSTMGTRFLKLAFTPAGGQALTVTAPANIHIAQPSFYQLFAVSRDDSYSIGSWLRLKGPWGSRPFSLPVPAQFVAAASSQFEAAAGKRGPRNMLLLRRRLFLHLEFLAVAVLHLHCCSLMCTFWTCLDVFG